MVTGAVRVAFGRWRRGVASAGLFRSRSQGRCGMSSSVTAPSAGGGPVMCGRPRRRGSTSSTSPRSGGCGGSTARTASMTRGADSAASAGRRCSGRCPGADKVSIAAGCLDAPTGIRTVEQIWLESAGDYYDVGPVDSPAWLPTSTPATASATSTARVSFYEKLGFEERARMNIGDEAINVFMGLPDEDPVLELTYNHGVDSYDLGTGYNHIAIAVDDLDGTLGELARTASSRRSRRTVPAAAPRAPSSPSSATPTATAIELIGTLKIRAAAIAVRDRRVRGTRRERGAVEAVTTPDGASTDQVGLARTGDGVLHVAWSAPHGPEHRGPPPHGDRARRQDRRHHPDPERVDGLHERGARGRAGRPARLLGRLPHHGLERSAARDEHRALAGRRRELGAPARARSSRTARSRMRATRPRPCAATGRRCRPSPGRSARGSMPASRRRRRTTTTRRRSGSTATTRTSRRTRANRTVMAWYSSASRPPRRAGAGRQRGRQPRRRRAHDAGHERHADRHARPHAAAWRAPAAVSTWPTRPVPARRVRVWRVGAAARRWSPRVAGSAAPPWRSRRPATGGCGCCGRRASATRTCSPRRSNKGATRFGATVNAGHPKDAHAGLQARRERRRRRRSTCSATSTSAPRRPRSPPTAGSCPASRSEAGPGRVRKGEPTEVRFTVLDAGDAVKGATVKAGGRSGTTDGRGRVTLTLSVPQAGHREGDALRLHRGDQAARSAPLSRRPGASLDVMAQRTDIFDVGQLGLSSGEGANHRSRGAGRRASSSAASATRSRAAR